MARNKSTAQTNVPQDRNAAVKQLEEIGSLERDIELQEAAQTEEINAIKAKTEANTKDLKDRLKALQKGLQTYCDANRNDLTNDQEVKHHDFGTGVVRWRNKTRRVNLKDPNSILKRLLKSAVNKDLFVRTTHEINKEALRAKPDIANKIEGISVGAEGEDFVIETNFEKTGDAA